MAVAWYVAPYRRRADPTRAIRYCAMNDFTPQITADGGDWMESEVLGNLALVKVRASDATLNTIAAEPGMVRLPLASLQDPLSNLTAAQRNALRDRVIAAGYTLAEITAAIPNLAQARLIHILRFWAKRKRKGRFDPDLDDWVFDGPDQPCTPLTVIDYLVADG